MPFPNDEDFFPLCTDNVNLGALGPGYPLFFEFIKGVGKLMMILTVVFFTPCCILMVDAYADLKDNLESDDSVVGLFSFGAFVQYVGEEKYSYLDYNKRLSYVQVVAILILLSIIISLIYLIWMRNNLLQTALKLDIDALTPSDFCLMGMNMKFDNYAPKEIEE